MEIYFANMNYTFVRLALQWRHNGRDGVSDHQPHDCLHNRLFRRRSKKTSKLRVTGLCVGNSPVTVEIPAQMASNAEIFPFDDVTMEKTQYELIFRCVFWLGVAERSLKNITLENSGSKDTMNAFWHFDIQAVQICSEVFNCLNTCLEMCLKYLHLALAFRALINLLCPIVMPYRNIDLNQHWLGQWLVAWRYHASEILRHLSERNFTASARVMIL